MSMSRHLKVKQAKILNKKHFLQFFLLQRSVPQGCSWHILAGKPSNTHSRGYSEYNVAWRGNTPLIHPPSPLISHPLPTLKSMQKMINWRSLVEHGLEVTKHLRHQHLGTEGWGCPLLGLNCRVRSRSYQGHFKVKPAIILNKTYFYSFHMFFWCKGVFHKAAVDILWLGSLPTRIIGGTMIIRGLEG